jgi:hypothetical protein
MLKAHAAYLKYIFLWCLPHQFKSSKKIEACKAKPLKITPEPFIAWSMYYVD